MDKIMELRTNELFNLIIAVIRENSIGFLVAILNYILITNSTLYIMEIFNINASGVMDWLKVLFYLSSMVLSFRLSWYVIQQRIRIMKAKADIISAEAEEKVVEARERINKLKDKR